MVQFTDGFVLRRLGIFFKCSLLIVPSISVISRAICLVGFVSSSHWPGTWQCVHVMPSAREKLNSMRRRKRAAVTPLVLLDVLEDFDSRPLFFARNRGLELGDRRGLIEGRNRGRGSRLRGDWRCWTEHDQNRHRHASDASEHLPGLHGGATATDGAICDLDGI